MYCSTFKTFLIILFCYVGRLLMFETLFGQRIGRERRLFFLLLQTPAHLFCVMLETSSLEVVLFCQKVADFFFSFSLMCSLSYLFCHRKGKMLLIVMYTGLKYLIFFLSP